MLLAAETSDRVRAGTVVVRASGGGQGAGSVWRNDGLVVTNHHVATGDRAEVIAEGRSYHATVVAREPSVDLAALQVEGDGLAALEVADSRALRVGELVLAVGNPFGEVGAVTAGIVSATGRGFQAGHMRLPEAVEANITLKPGNSGGPLTDADGRVAGINTMVLGPGVALAVASSVVTQFLHERAPGGAVLGIGGQQVILTGVEAERGILLTEVVDGGAAAYAGLMVGDVLLAIDGVPLSDGPELLRQLSQRAPGEPRRVSFLRGGRLREVTVAPGRRGARM